MQACKDLCLQMLTIKRVVQTLDLTSTHTQHLTTQLSQIMQYCEDLLRVGYEESDVIVNFLRMPTSQLQHLQLVKCFAGLLTAVVNKLNRIEQVSSSGMTHDNRVPWQADKYLVMWILLVDACYIFRTWPSRWPEQGVAEYSSTRQAMFELMSFLVQGSRSSSDGAWQFVWKKQDTDGRHQQVQAILSFPLTYMLNLGTWSVPCMVRELAALPPEFLSILCCLLLEMPLRCLLSHLSNPPAISVAEAAVADASGHSFRTLTLSLGTTMTTVIQRLCESDLADALRLLCTPALVQLYKHVVLTHTSPQSADGIGDDEWNLMHALVVLLEICAQANYQAELSNHVLPGHIAGIYEPLITVSDVALLRGLFRWRPPPDQLFNKRCFLAGSLVLFWRDPSKKRLPFPVPTVQDQVKGLYLAAHHCIAEMVICMKEHQWWEHSQRDTDFCYSLSQDLPHLITLVQTKIFPLLHLPDEVASNGE